MPTIGSKMEPGYDKGKSKRDKKMKRRKRVYKTGGKDRAKDKPK